MSVVKYYNVGLEWLSIPNKVLKVGYGGNISAYPYVYIELYNEGFLNSVTTMLSNNPNSAVAIFKIPVDRYLYDIPTFFYTLRGDNRKQTILFRPDQTLRFRVKLGNGEIIQDSTLDNTSPSPSNPLLQVNASFLIEPVN